MTGMTWAAMPSQGLPREDLLFRLTQWLWAGSHLLRAAGGKSAQFLAMGAANKELGFSNMASCAINARKRFRQQDEVAVFA